LRANRALRGTLLISACYLATSCATLDQAGARHGTAIGCGVGAVVGGLLGNVVGQKTGNRQLATVAGAAVGTAIGCYAGNRWQKREQALQDLATREHMRIETQTLAVAPSSRTTDGASSPQEAGLVANVQNQGMFATDSDQLTLSGLRQAKALAQIYRPDASEQASTSGVHPVLLVVGHTDATGAADYNQALSERRAEAMGRVLAQAGIDPRNIYFQGAGASRPIADNTTEDGRGRNRRVELVELSSSDLLVQRIEQERANPRYLAHGTRGIAIAASTTPVRPVPSTRKQPPKNSVSRVSPRASKEVATSKTGVHGAAHANSRPAAGYVDFGGIPASADHANLASLVTPRRSGFSLISTAYAADVPMRSCEADRPRVSGSVKNLASGQALDTHATREYLPGMNGRAWAGLVNGNLVTLSPVAVLRDGADVVKNPVAYVTRDYAAGHRKATRIDAVANAYEGENSILYRVFMQSGDAPVSCMDLVLRKAGDSAAGGKLYYDRSGNAYVADFKPTRS
jgi:outer membrane protein OmpA-like peptidoglycan-associated protein